MAVLGRPTDKEETRREDAVRVAVAIIFATGFHLLLFKLMMFKTPTPFEVTEDFIAIELVTLPPSTQIVELPEKPPEENDAPLPPPQPIVKPKPATPPPAQTTITVAPDILASKQSATVEDAGNTVPLSETGIVPTPAPITAPSERSADEQRIDEGLKSLAADLKCLNGFDVDCAEIRKEVFEDFQMTETDKVYTKKYAHTGLPAEFYGISERAIRAKLSVPNAGENGLVIIPGLLALDGNWWDAMHGVNKKCTWKIAAPAKSDAFARSGELSSAVRHGAIKDCPDYLPAAREDRDRRNKFQVRLEANEARREAEKDDK